MWLSNKIFSWSTFPESSRSEGRQGVHRPYEIWEHAESLLSIASNSFHRVDAITTIKRSIDHRLRQLRTLYCFDEIPIKAKPKRIVEQLAFFGIVRPTMLEQLILLRNQIEHGDAPPPDQSRCSEFLDFAWYFLRSTDRLVSSIAANFVLEPAGSAAESPYWLEVEMGPRGSWKVELSGWVPRRLISKTEHEDWLNLDIERLETRQNFLGRLPRKERKKELASATRGKNPTDTYISGAMNGPEIAYKELLNRYFSTSILGI